MLRFLTYLAPSIPRELFAHVARRAGERCGVETSLDFETRISGPLEGDDDPFADGRADVGFVCAPTYRWMRERVTLLPALVPLDPRAGGRPVYFADVVVRAGSPVARFDELRGRRWAYNDRNSRSGWFSMLERVGGDARFFSETLHAGSHLRSLAAVREGRADAAAIDSNVLFRERCDDLRIIETWGPYPIQPAIVRNGVEDALKSRLAAALLEIDGMAPFGFARFAPVTPADYE
jgi:ABC-type phosphate/phosphonate transport system substrate-binding protein